MNVPADLKYLRTHEWCRVEGGEATIGITDYAQDQLGDVVYVELPGEGTVLESRDEPFGTIESVKAASDLFPPVTGEVVAVNEQLEDHVELINTEPYGKGWMIRVRLDDPGELDELLDAATYTAHVESEG